MTLGIFMPLLAALLAIGVVPLFLMQLRRLPGPTDPGYDAATVSGRARTLRIIIAWQFLGPVVLYVILNLIAPEAGGMVLF